LQQEYRDLGTAVLRQACRDLIRFSRAKTCGEYRSARRFLNSVLFERICRVSGTDPGLMRDQILQRAGQTGGAPRQDYRSCTNRASGHYEMRVAETRPPYHREVSKQSARGHDR
jgi:hypothetical protein